MSAEQKSNEIDFNSNPTKLVYFFSDHPFKSNDERRDYAMNLIKKSSRKEHLKKYRKSNNEYFDFNEKRVQWIENQLSAIELQDDEDLRKNLRILIVIGSKLKLTNNICSGSDLKGKGYYIQGYEDMNTALLIAHLFHYACKIDYDNILITSLNPHNFISTKIPEATISTKPSKETKDESYNSDDHSKKIPPNLYRSDTSTIFDDVAYVQIGSKHIQFVPDIDVECDIKPFNRYFLRQLKTNEHTELLVILLDQCYKRFFEMPNYEYIVERLIELTTRHITIFNQSCYSGSLIELIEISEQINEIFVSYNDSKQAIFQKLISLAHDKTQSIDEKISFINNNYHISSSESTKQKVINILNHLTHYKENLSISPELFIQLKNKSTIFCSCSSTSECSTLPLRQVIGPNKIFANSHGGVFSSIFINCLFQPSEYNDFTFSKFTQNLQDELINIDSQLKDVIVKQYSIDQHLPIYEKIEEQCISTQEEIINYFNTNFTKQSVSISSRDKIPNIKSILLPKQFWNIDVCDVDSLEYNVKAYDYNNFNSHDDYDYDDENDGYDDSDFSYNKEENKE